MDPVPFDLLRVLAFATFGVGVGIMVVNNALAFQVLRPRARLGFLWWHVTAISAAFLCIGVVGLESVAGRFGTSPTWHSPLFVLGCSLFAVAQVLIFRVERARLVDKRALATLGTSPPP